MYARKFNQNDTHQCESTCDAHILGWRLETEQTDHIGYADIQPYCHQIRDIPLSILPQEIIKEVV